MSIDDLEISEKEPERPAPLSSSSLAVPSTTLAGTGGRASPSKKQRPTEKTKAHCQPLLGFDQSVGFDTSVESRHSSASAANLAGSTETAAPDLTASHATNLTSDFSAD